MQPDYYMILGVEHTASSLEIKKAYRSLALKYHPDMNQGDDWAEEKFKLISQAYDVLKKSETRKTYDRTLLKNVTNQQRTGGRHKDVFNMPGDELLRDFYRGFYLRQENPETDIFKGDDIRQNVKITFAEAVYGTETKIYMPRVSTCTLCSGTGMKPGAKRISCTICKGKGVVKDKRDFYRMCLLCKGTGIIATAYCKKCHGRGKVWARQAICIKVPPGVETGTRLQIKGMGMKGNVVGAAGDFVVVVQIEKHPFLKRSGFDIVCDVPIPFTKAKSGTTMNIPTLHGLRKITVPARMTTGKTIVIQDLGMCSLDNKKPGSLIVRFNVELPKKSAAKNKSNQKTSGQKNNGSHYPQTERFNRKIGRYYGTSYGRKRKKVGAVSRNCL